jgi:hypothetical protein
LILSLVLVLFSISDIYKMVVSLLKAIAMSEASLTLSNPHTPFFLAPWRQQENYYDDDDDGGVEDGGSGGSSGSGGVSVGITKATISRAVIVTAAITMSA